MPPNSPVEAQDNQDTLQALNTLLNDLGDDAPANNTIRVNTLKTDVTKVVTDIKTQIKNHNTAAIASGAISNLNESQAQVNQHNRELLSKLASDYMTQSRIATMHQQNTLWTESIVGYFRIMCVFLFVMVLFLALFTIPFFKDVFEHPVVIIEVVIVLVVVICVGILGYRYYYNSGRTPMLYQERDFYVPNTSQIVGAEYESGRVTCAQPQN